MNITRKDLYYAAAVFFTKKEDIAEEILQHGKAGTTDEHIARRALRIAKTMEAEMEKDEKTSGVRTSRDDEMKREMLARMADMNERQAKQERDLFENNKEREQKLFEEMRKFASGS